MSGPLSFVSRSHMPCKMPSIDKPGCCKSGATSAYTWPRNILGYFWQVREVWRVWSGWGLATSSQIYQLVIMKSSYRSKTVAHTDILCTVIYQQAGGKGSVTLALWPCRDLSTSCMKPTWSRHNSAETGFCYPYICQQTIRKPWTNI